MATSLNPPASASQGATPTSPSVSDTHSCLLRQPLAAHVKRNRPPGPPGWLSRKARRPVRIELFWVWANRRLATAATTAEGRRRGGGAAAGGLTAARRGRRRRRGAGRGGRPENALGRGARDLAQHGGA